jgi:hypothetical protein
VLCDAEWARIKIRECGRREEKCKGGRSTAGEVPPRISYAVRPFIFTAEHRRTDLGTGEVLFSIHYAIHSSILAGQGLDGQQKLTECEPRTSARQCDTGPTIALISSSSTSSL